jgi:hypothetical protein
MISIAGTTEINELTKRMHRHCQIPNLSTDETEIIFIAWNG